MADIFGPDNLATSALPAGISDYVPGVWTIDPIHSEVGFSVRHLMVSKVRGRFRTFSGEIVTAADRLSSRVTAAVDLTSIDTGNADRDRHLRSADFFQADAYRTMTYASAGIRQDGEGYILDGELTLRGVVRRVPLHLEIGGFGPDRQGVMRAGFTAWAEIKRSDFGIDFNPTLETGAVLIGDRVSINLEIEAVLTS